MTQNITDKAMKRTPVRGDTNGQNFIADRVALSLKLELLKFEAKRKTKKALSIHHKKFNNALLISLDYDT